MKMDMDNIKVGKIPGKDELVNGVWFFFHNEEETKELVNELFFNVPSTDNEETSQNNVTNTDS